MNRRVKYTEGEKVGIFTFIKDIDSSDKKRRAVFLCGCGREFESVISELKRDDSRSRKSCGECAAFKSPIYFVWRGMIARCHYSSSNHYPQYGGRGIKVCERWKSSFNNFATDIGARPTASHTIDRIDVNGDYCKENCRWSTRLEQSNNKRNSVFMTLNGETLTVAMWARKLNVRVNTLHGRRDLGWSDYEVLTKPVNQYKKISR